MRKLSGIASLAIAAGMLGASAPDIMYQQQTPKAVHSATARQSMFRRRRNTGTGWNGNRALPKEVQLKLIEAAKAKRERKSETLTQNALWRDRYYYRVSAASNAHRFCPIGKLEVSHV